VGISGVRDQEPGARGREREGRRVRVRVGELVLDGFPPGDRFRIAEEVKRELARLIGEQGLGRLAGPAANAAVVDAGAFPVTPGGNAGAIGRRVAQSVHRGLTGGRAR
jgi:hypothetical protein